MYVRDPLRVVVTGPLAAYAAGFCAELERQGYASQPAVSRQLLVRRTAQRVRAPGRRMPLCVHARISHDWHGY